jgi:hypothetical protein
MDLILNEMKKAKDRSNNLCSVSKGITIYESESMRDEVALGTYLDSLMNASTSEMVDFRTIGAVEFLETSNIIEVPAAVVGVESFDTVPLILEE